MCAVSTCSILSVTKNVFLQMILDQQDRDTAIRDLLEKLSEVYAFMNEDGRLAEIATMQELYGKLARQTLECADFIVHYAETKSACKSTALRHLHPAFNNIFWTGKRLAKDVFRDTGSAIQSYNNVFDNLMQQFRDGAVRDIVVNVYRSGKS